MTAKLWTPESPSKGTLKCMVPGCGRIFPDTKRTQWERHVSSCAKRNIDAIQEMVEERRDVFSDVAQDKEMHKWLRDKSAEHGPTEANKRLRGRKGR